MDVLYKFREELEDAKIIAAVAGIGSYFAFGEGVDKDIVVFVVDASSTVQALIGLGFTVTSEDLGDAGSGGGGDHFTAMRRGDLNLLVTQDADFYHNSIKAFAVVCVLNLRDKVDRIRVHKIVVDNWSYDELVSEGV